MTKELIVALALLLLPPAAISQVPELEMSVRKAIDIETAELWEKEDFSQLEKISADYRKNRTKTPSGLWKLTVLYASLREQISSDSEDPAWWDFMRRRATKWTTAFPNSPTAHLQYAESLLRQAWHARGHGFSNTVTPQGSRLFQEQVSEARSYLEKHKGVAATDPRWYELMIDIATWQGRNEHFVKTLLDEALSREPAFWQTYFAATEYYSPYWRGSAKKIEKFADWAAGRIGGADGDALYTRIYWYAASRYFKNQFFDTSINCERMMRGIDRIVQTHPDPWNINHFASFAVSCGDRARARSLFLRIGDNPDLEAWGRSSKTFARFKSWAME